MKRFKDLFCFKKMTKAQMKKYISIYESGNCYSVKDCYAKPSKAKCIAENEIKNRMEKAGGFGYKILTGNNIEFSVGYIISNETGVYFIVETHFNIFFVKIK